MLIWSGLGFIVPLITVAFLLATEFIFRVITHSDTLFQTHGWPKFLGFLMASIAVWAIGDSLEKRKGKIFIEKETGEEIELKPGHSFFFVPLRFWGPILTVMGIFLAFVKG